MKKIVLINPPIIRNIHSEIRPNHYPLSLLIIREILTRLGEKVFIKDYFLNCKNNQISGNKVDYQKIVSEIGHYNPDIIGITTTCFSYPIVLMLVTHLKKKYPQVIIMLGGIQASTTDMESMNKFPIDIIIRGEAENTLVELFEKIDNVELWKDIKGITFRNKSGQIIRNEIRNEFVQIANCDYNPDMLYRDINLININNNSGVYIEGGRGCPFNCTYCSTSNYWGHIYRVRNPESIFRDIKYINSHYSISHFEIVHDLFFVSKKEFKKFCKLLMSNDMKITWGCLARVDTVDSESLELFYRSGGRRLYFGIESGSERINKLINKQFDIDRISMVIGDCKQKKLQCVSSFIIGFPTENRSEINQTLQLMVKIASMNNYVLLNRLMLLPGTVLFDEYSNSMQLNYDSTGIEYSNTIDEWELIRTNPSLFSCFYEVKSNEISSKEMNGLLFGFTKLVNSYNQLLIKNCDQSISFIEIYNRYEEFLCSKYGVEQIDYQKGKYEKMLLNEFPKFIQNEL